MSNVMIQGKLATDRTKPQEVYVNSSGTMGVSGIDPVQKTFGQITALLSSPPSHGYSVLASTTGDDYTAGIIYDYDSIANEMVPSDLNFGGVIILKNSAYAASFAVADGANTGAWICAPAKICSFEAYLSNTTTPAATVEIHGTNTLAVTPGAGTLLTTLTLSGASDVVSSTEVSAAYRYKCAKVTAISGTSAVCTVKMGV